MLTARQYLPFLYEILTFLANLQRFDELVYLSFMQTVGIV